MTSRSEEGDAGSGTTPPARPRAMVVGLGLIGGSLSLALRQHGWHVTGRDTLPGRAGEARARGIIDAEGDDPGAEVVLLAVPAGAVAAEARALLTDPARPARLVVTDVSGVKEGVVAAVDHPRFVGGHPMAGSEQAGLDGADPDLFTGAAWVLTPTAGTDLDAFGRVQGLAVSLGADVVVLSPEDHDRLVAVVSHVPHLVAASLVNTAARHAEHDAALLRLAAGGFRDMTRVAAGQPEIWPDVCAQNSEAIVAALDQVTHSLAELRRLVAGRDRDGVYRVLQQASRSRRALPARGVRPGHLAELRIPVPDREGVLAEITSLAVDLGVNIYDIEIAHSAEGDRGVLILLVRQTDAAPLAGAVAARGYRATSQPLPEPSGGPTTS